MIVHPPPVQAQPRSSVGRLSAAGDALGGVGQSWTPGKTARHPMRALRFICAFFLAWIVGIESASARILRVWTMDEIADKAEVLLVGEIVEISAVEKIDADKTRWNTPLLRMAAKIRVLRTFEHVIDPENRAGVFQVCRNARSSDRG